AQRADHSDFDAAWVKGESIRIRNDSSYIRMAPNYRNICARQDATARDMLHCDFQPNLVVAGCGWPGGNQEQAGTEYSGEHHTTEPFFQFAFHAASRVTMFT